MAYSPIEEALKRAKVTQRAATGPDGRITKALERARSIAPVTKRPTIKEAAQPEKSGDIEFWGKVGDFVDFLDTPRAAIASTAQELVDVFQGEGFSPKDWLQQTKDNHLFGEVLRDTGLTGYLEDKGYKHSWLPGLGLDVAFDPWTYAFGIGLAGRTLTTAPKVSQALKAAANTAKTAGRMDDHARLLAASETVRKTKSISSAGKSLDDIGIKPNMGFTVPGTGRFSRQIIENPLNYATRGKWGAKWDQRRIKQLPDFVVGEGQGWVAKNNDKILEAMRLMRRSDDASVAALRQLDDPIKRAAGMASKMAVEGLRIPGTAGLVGMLASMPGRAWNAAAQLKLFNAADNLINTKASIRQLEMTAKNPDDALVGSFLSSVRNEGKVAQSTIETALVSDVNRIGAQADALGVDRSVIQLASAQPYHLTDEAGNILIVNGRQVINPALPESITRLGAAGEEFHKTLVDFWDNAKVLFDDVAGDARFEPLINDMYAARTLKEGNVINKDSIFRAASPSRKFSLRSYVTPSQYDEYVRQLGQKEANRLYSKTFYGEEIFDVTGPNGVGKGVQQQMDEIGQRLFGAKWVELFEDDFFKVAEEYIGRLGRLASDTRVATSLENAGQLIPVEVLNKNFQGKLTSRLDQALKKVDAKKVELGETRKIAVEAQNKIDDLKQGASVDQASARRIRDELQSQLDDLMEDVTQLPDVMLPNTKRVVGDIQKNLGERSKTYAARALIVQEELNLVNRIMTAVARGQDPALFSELRRNVKTISDALRAYNVGQSAALLSDETVAGMRRLERLLRGELDLGPMPASGFNPKDPAVQRFETWEEIASEAMQLDQELEATLWKIHDDWDEIREAKTLVDEEIQAIEDAFNTGLYVDEPVDVQRYIRLQQDAMQYQQSLVDRELAGLQQALAAQTRIFGEASQDVKNLNNMVNTIEANEIRSLRLDIADAKASPDLKVQLTAAESQAEAVAAINNKRSILGFQENYNQAASNRIRQTGFDDYVAVNTNEFKEMFDDAFLASARINDPRAVSEFLTGYPKFLNWWKAQAIASPGFILRNGQGGVWVNTQIARIEMGLHSKVEAMRREAVKRGTGPTSYDRLLTGARILRDEGKTIPLKRVFGNKSNRTASGYDLKVFADMVESGIVGRGQAVSEVARDVLGTRAGTWNPFSADFKLFQGMRRANERMEFILRGAVAFDAMAYKGKSLDDAYELVAKYHFDYSDLTNAERKIKLVYPFWKWQKSIIPVLIESMGKNPTAWSRLGQLKGELELDIGEENLWPSYVLKRYGIELPFMFQGGRAMTMPDLPFQDFATMVNDPSEAPRKFFEGVAPFIKLPVERHFGEQVFGGLPLEGRFQQVPNLLTTIPGVMDALDFLRMAKRNSKGEWRMRDKDIYTLEALSPILGRSRRLWPNEKSKQRRWITSMVSFFFGGSLRFHNDADDRFVWHEEQKKLEKDIRDQQDLENRRK